MMNFGEADELDYEEDELPDDSVETGSQSKNFSENSNLSGSDDQYLQIDFQEEEENFFPPKEPVENVFAETQNGVIDSEDGGKGKNFVDCVLPDSKTFMQTSASNFKSNDAEAAEIKNAHENKESIKSFESQPEIKKNFFKGLNFSFLFPEFTFRESQNAVKPHRFCRSPKSNTLNRGYYPKKSSFLPFSQKEKNLQQLMTIRSKKVPFGTLNSFSPTGTVAKKCNLARRRNKPFSNHFSGPSFNKNHSDYQIQNKRITLSKNLKCCENPESKIIMENENINKISIFEQSLSIKNGNNYESSAENFQTVEERNFKRIFHDRNPQGPGSNIKFHGCGFVRKNKNAFFNVQYNFLKEGEKELVSLKKEARLKRFSRDDTVMKTKKSMNSVLDESCKKGLNLEEEYFQKMAEQKLLRERFLSLKKLRQKNSNCDRRQSFRLEKPNINKESLLKKRNPFDVSSGGSQLLPGTKIKQESESGAEIKKECVDDKLLACIKIDSQIIKDDGNILTTSSSSSQSFSMIKNETKSPVKFVRTVSKCFDELAFKKPKTKVIFNRNRNESPFSYVVKTFPIVEENKMNSIVRDFPAKIEPQLTGCIVKVLNIPPSTTTNDVLALCCPVGMVREVKLNFPKENSVVIRFVEPACAEKFFSLYHGQKMNNYFLNVIIV